MSYSGLERGAVCFSEAVISEQNLENLKSKLLTSSNPRVVHFLNDLEYRIGEIKRDGKNSHREEAVQALHKFYSLHGIKINSGNIEKALAEEIDEENIGFIAIGNRVFRNHDEMASRIAEDYVN